MESNKSFEDKIRTQLMEKASEIEPSHELYSRVMTDIMYKKRGSFALFKNRIFNMSKKSLVAAALCFTVLAGAITYGSSSSFRAFAAETANKIKTIFVLEGNSKNYKVVEEPTNKPIFITLNSKTTTLSDAELSKKVGVKVVFPKALSNGYTLNGKSEFVSLHKIDYETGQKLQNDILKAISDEAVFNSLAAYEPIRGTHARYVKDQSEAFIYITPIPKELEAQLKSIQYTEVDINSTIGYWIEIPVPSYPTVSNNGISSDDMTQKPTDVKIAHNLIWVSNGAYYQLTFSENKEFNKNAAVAFATSFMNEAAKGQ